MSDFDFIAPQQAAQPAQAVADKALQQATSAQANADRALQQVTAAEAQSAGAAPREVYRALQAQRRELGNQLRTLENRRDGLARDLSRGPDNSANVAGIEARIKSIDARIASVDAQIAQADLAVARSAAVPGSVVPDPPFRREGPPEQVYPLAALFMFVTFLPISLSYARRIWRRSATVAAPIPAELLNRIETLTETVETMAVEVERIGEGQRFITRVLSEPREHAMLPNSAD